LQHKELMQVGRTSHHSLQVDACLLIASASLFGSESLAFGFQPPTFGFPDADVQFPVHHHSPAHLCLARFLIDISSVQNITTPISLLHHILQNYKDQHTHVSWWHKRTRFYIAPPSDDW
jgi:hypothetical protein